MIEYIIDLAKKIYLNTPYKTLRQIYFRVFCWFVRNKIVHTSIAGINYKLDLGEVIDLGIYLNRYEPDMTSAIGKTCKPGFNVLDIGANIGAHTLPIAKLISESGRVYAFEPTEYAYQKLVHNISLNPFRNITPVQVALSDRNLLQQSIHFRSSWPTAGSPKSRESIVDFIMLDDWFKKENLEHVDLIKLDVDGNEYSVIMGAKSLLASQRPTILMEVWGPNFSDNLKNPFIVLKELGYRFYHITTGEEYTSINDLRSIVSLDGKLLDAGFDIIVK
jgi:FkbM family methyltransferase